MILRLSDSLSRGLLVLAAIAAAVVVSYFGIRMALAARAAEGTAAKDFQAAARLEPRNPEYWYRLGHYEEYSLEDPDPALAEDSLHRAIALDPHYTEAWLDLATAYELEGNSEATREAYQRAEQSYPVSVSYTHLTLPTTERV